nr:hypothetical protein [uncultured Anaerostipes sp.]
MLLLQIILFCLLYISMVKYAAGNSGLNCLYFYPEEYIEEAQKRGIADKEATMKKGKHFMIPFCVIILIALILIISVWNHVTDFKTAYIQAVIFLVIVNWFDGIVIDQLWVGHSKLWMIEGMEGVPYTKPWGYMIKRRILASIMYLGVAVIVAAIVVLIWKF